MVTTTEAMTAPTTVPMRAVEKPAQRLAANPVNRASLVNPVKADAAAVAVVARATPSSSPKTVRPSAR